MNHPSETGLLERVDEPQSEAKLRAKVSLGFAVALILTCLLSFLSWRMAQQAHDDADWVAHTHEVSTTLEATLRHLVDVETGGRGFALTGNMSFLEPYETGKSAVGGDLQMLRQLVAANVEQTRRLDALEVQASARIRASADIVSSRQNTGKVPTLAQFEQGKQLMDTARATIAEMESTEKRLLQQRTERARAAQRLNLSLIGLGALAGVILLSVAGATVSREIGISSRARTQVISLNAALERRVEQRTAALQSEIANREEAEAKLRASEEMFRTLLDGIKDYAVYMLDAGGRVVSWNSGAARIKGYRTEEIIGKHVSCFYTETDREHNCPQEALREAAQAGRFEGEGWRVRKDSSRFWANFVITPLHERNGTLRGYSKVVRDITDRKRSEDELKKQAALLELAHDAILVRDLQSKVLFWNGGAEDLYGWPRGEASGRVTHELLQTKFPVPLTDIEAVLATKGDWEGELRHVTRHGTEVIVASRWSIQRDEFGEPAAILEINRDITDRKQAEAALGESESRVAGIVQSAMDSIITVDEEQRIVLFNNAAERVFLCPAAEAIGKLITRFIPQRFHAAHAGHIRKFGETGVTNRAMGLKNLLWAVRADGQEFPIEASISQVVTGGKKLFTVILRDVTERAQAEAMRERMAAIVESSDDAIISKDLNGIINAWNRGAEKIFGYTADEAVAQSMLMIFPPELVPEEADILARIGRGESVEHYETVRVRKDGTKIDVSVTISPIRDSTGRIVGASKVARDITERKRAEAALREKEHLLSESQRIAHLGSWTFDPKDASGQIVWSEEMYRIYGVSPDIFTPTVASFLELVVPDDRAAMQKWIANCAAGQRPGDLDYRAVMPDGTIRFFSGRGELQLESEGQPVRMAGSAQDITDRRRVEESLRRSDAGRVVALEAANLGEWEIDLGTKETRHSQRHDRIFGYASPPEWSPEIFFQHVHPDDRARARMNLEVAVSQGTKLETECRIILPDGEIRWIRACGDLYRDSAGNSTRMFGTVEDITERKNAAEALRLSEERLRLAMDGARMGTWHWNLETGELVWSRCCLALFGLPPDIRMSYEIFLGALHPGDRVPAEQAVRRSLDEHKEYDIEYRTIWPDGSQHWIAARGQGYYDAAGKAVRMEGVVMDVTERKRAEEALRESQTNFAAVVNLAPQFVWICSNEGLNTYFNDRWFQYTGLTPEQSYGRGWNTRFHPDDKQTAWEAWNHATATAETYTVESRLRAADGTYRWFLMRGEPVRGEDGGIVKWFGTCTDIDDMKRVQAELRESEERFQAMANGIPQLAWMAEADGHIFWYNQRWYDYTGTTFEKMEGWGWQSVHDPEMLPRVLERWKGSIARGEPFEMEFPLLGGDGRFRMFLTRVMPVRDAEGHIVRWFGTNTDISERKATEEKLAGQAEELTRQAEELIRSQQDLETQKLMLQSVLDSMEEGLVAADEQGKFIIWNPAAARIVGLGGANVPPEEWGSYYGAYLPDMITPFPTDQNPLVRAIRGELCSTEIFIRNAELEQGVWIESNGAPLRDKDGALHGGVVAFRDITQKKAAELEIRKLNETLEERIAQRTAQLEVANRELESFTYSVSHDLRAPLRHIMGFAGACLEEFGATLDPQALHYVQRIQDGTRRMGVLTDELLNLARTGQRSMHLQLTGLNSIVEELISMLKTETEGREVEWKIGSLPSVECDPVLVRQVFQNLLSNAIKYSRRRPHAVIEIGHTQEKDQQIIFVRDNGAGFNMQYADKLFGVFQRLHRDEEFEGTGVGLATVHRIVQKHGGRIWAEAEVDHGATFYFTLGCSERAGSRGVAATAGA